VAGRGTQAFSRVVLKTGPPSIAAGCSAEATAVT
jgi:hypothetical protein